MLRKTLLITALLAPPLVVVGPLDRASTDGCIAPAEATIARALSLGEMVSASSAVVVATAGERHSVWEDLPSGRRIVTYTKLSVERVVHGTIDKEVWVRTLGGAVGSVGQAVSGEAQILTGSRSMVFLAKVSGVVVVTAMAQGHYPIAESASSKPTLRPSPDAGTILPRGGPFISVREELVGRSVDEGIALVIKATHGKK